MEIVVVLPTYNEAQNITGVVRELLALPLDIEVLVVDDLSPDGTWKIVEELGQADKRVHLLLRRENRGRGWAGIDGFKKALEMGAQYVVEMDSDFSHSPRYLPAMKAKMAEADMVLGSRFVEGGKDEARTLIRRMISGFARRYLALVLGVRVQDPSSGYRMFTAEALRKIVPRLNARDPFIVSEVLFFAQKFRLKIAEVPIEFFVRSAGESKLNPSTLFKYLLRVWKLRFTNLA
jgi:dolichol-phosphate mannosyltransferase